MSSAPPRIAITVMIDSGASGWAADRSSVAPPAAATSHNLLLRRQRPRCSVPPSTATIQRPRRAGATPAALLRQSPHRGLDLIDRCGLFNRSGTLSVLTQCQASGRYRVRKIPVRSLAVGIDGLRRIVCASDVHPAAPFGPLERVALILVGLLLLDWLLGVRLCWRRVGIDLRKPLLRVLGVAIDGGFVVVLVDHVFSVPPDCADCRRGA
jgi:hypothetical protein